MVVYGSIYAIYYQSNPPASANDMRSTPAMGQHLCCLVGRVGSGRGRVQGKGWGLQGSLRVLHVCGRAISHPVQDS